MCLGKLEADWKSVRQSRTMGDDDENVVLLLMQIQKKRSDGVGGRFVEISRGFITDKKIRFSDERTRYGDSLLLSSRELRGRVVNAFKKAHLANQRPGVRHRIRRWGDQRRDEHVLEHRTLRQQAVVLKHESDFAIAEPCEFDRSHLKNISAADQDIPTRGIFQTPKDVEQRALSRP